MGLRVRRPLLEDAWGVVCHAVAVTKQLLHGQSAVRGTRARQYVMKRWQQWVVAEQTRRSRDEEAREDEFLAEMEGKADELFHVHGLLYGMLVWSLRTREAADERHHQEMTAKRRDKMKSVLAAAAAHQEAHEEPEP